MSERKCLNKGCPYHSGGKCNLFPGDAWTNCKRAGLATTKPNKKGK
jgi:hypothetical protein